MYRIYNNGVLNIPDLFSSFNMKINMLLKFIDTPANDNSF